MMRRGVLAAVLVLSVMNESSTFAQTTTTTTLPALCHQVESCGGSPCSPAVPEKGCQCQCPNTLNDYPAQTDEGCVVLNPPVLDTDRDRYGIIAMTQAKLYSIQVADPGCNVGVDCDISAKNGPCGVLQHDDASYLTPSEGGAGAWSQMVAGKARFRSKKGRAAMGAVFTHDETENGMTPNDYENTCIPVSSTWKDGKRTDDRDHLNESILFRLGGGPVCEIVGQSCDIDTAALEDHLGMYPTNPCDEDAKSVTVYYPPIGSNDCDCGVTSGNVIDDCDDQNPGNGVCELPPGSYDRIKVEKSGRLRFVVDGEENEFIACQVTLGKNSITATDPGVVIHTGDFNVDHVGCFGLQECTPGDWSPGPACLTSSTTCPAIADYAFPACSADTAKIFVYEKGDAKFGKHTQARARLIAPTSRVSLGQDMKLSGKVLGDYVLAGKGGLELFDCCQGESTF